MKKLKVQTKPDWCKGCGICVSFCPKSCLALDVHEQIKMLNPQDCISCKMCENLCPDFAIFLVEDKEKIDN